MAQAIKKKGGKELEKQIKDQSKIIYIHVVVYNNAVLKRILYVFRIMILNIAYLVTSIFKKYGKTTNLWVNVLFYMQYIRVDQGPSMSFKHSKKIPHIEACFSWPMKFNDNERHTKFRDI